LFFDAVPTADVEVLYEHYKLCEGETWNNEIVAVANFMTFPAFPLMYAKVVPTLTKYSTMKTC